MKRIASAGLLLGVLLACGPAAAQTDSARTKRSSGGDDQRSPAESYWLRVKADRVNLRSRADANSVVVARLRKDAVLQATGEEFGWHSVIPPKGVFSFVSAEYVDMPSKERGIVSVRGGNLRVRVGSRVVDVKPLQGEVQALLPRGTEVRIVGRQGDWLKIVPPEQVRVYVSAEYVARVSAEVAGRLRAAEAAAERSTRAEAGEGAAERRRRDPPDLSGTWGQRLVMIEAAMAAEARKPIDARAWTEPIAKLRPIAAQRLEPAVARLASEWIDRLETRMADESALLAAREIARRESRARTRFDREMKQIERARKGATTRPKYDAVGQLVLSNALRTKEGLRRFMLRDPLTARVVAYVEFGSDARPKLEALAGKYVGLRGAKRYDRKLGAEVIRVKTAVSLQQNEPTSRPARETP